MLLAAIAVFPSYGQVKLADFGATEELRWHDSFSARGYLAGDHTLLIRTREPTDGDVTVEVHDQAPGDAGTLVYDGPLAIDSGVLSVSGVDEDDQETYRLHPAGARSVQVYVDQADEPGRVVVVVRPAA